MKHVLFHILFAIIVFDNAFLTQLVKVKYVFEHFNERRQGSDNSASHIQAPNEHDRLPLEGEEQPAEEDLTLELHFHFHEPEKPLLQHPPAFGITADYHLPHFYDLPHPHLEDLFRPPKYA